MKKMLQHTNKAEAKRKFDLIESNPTKMTVIKKKMPLKSELNTQLKEIQAKYESLEKETKKTGKQSKSWKKRSSGFNCNRYQNLKNLEY